MADKLIQTLLEEGTYPFPNFLPTKAITADYTVDPSTDYGLVVAAVAADITITLPLYSELTAGIYQILEIIPIIQNGYKVRIATQGSDTFPFGNTWFDLPSSQRHFAIGMSAHGYNLRRNVTVKAGYVRSTAWNATNFSSAVVLPFETVLQNTQTELLQWDSAGRITAQVDDGADFDIVGGFSIDSTGGSTWNCSIELRKNGTYVDYSRVTTGNYGGEDDSIFGFMDVHLDKGDYVELWISQNNLTGTLLTAKASLSTRL